MNKAHYPVTVLGPGRRIGIWFQGCSIRCKGCLSIDTWEPDDERAIETADLLAWCQGVAREGIDGVTLSGGEPFDQPEALCELVDGLRRWRNECGLSFDILCYSGHPYATLVQRYPDILCKLDAVISEPFVQARAPIHVWRGSANQCLIPLSGLGHARIGPFVETTITALGKRFQMSVEGAHVWYIGVPLRGELLALEQSCQERGLIFDEVSWRA
ncbi:MAG: 4Fe-4S single cluster domain-containing protein [Burkholderiaceae bacterium]